MMRVLVTAFEPFGGAAVNASAEAVALLPAGVGSDIEIVTSTLPVVFGDAATAIVGLLDRHAPDVVVAVGEAGGRGSVDLERVAVNVDDARIPDNAGNAPVDEPVVAGAPAAYLSTLPIKACARAAEAAGTPASVSGTAGSFVCNHVFFALMHSVADRAGVRAGFVHVPTIDRLASARTAAALEAIVVTAARTHVDVVESRGRES